VRRTGCPPTIDPGVTASDITALVWAMRGLAQAAAGDAAPGTRQRFLDVHLAGLRTAAPHGRRGSQDPAYADTTTMVVCPTLTLSLFLSRWDW
jgi:hypothetical protein